MKQDSTILLYTYTDIQQANIIRDKLKAQGIDSFIENEDVPGVKHADGIRVRIFSKDQESAEKLINE